MVTQCVRLVFLAVGWSTWLVAHGAGMQVLELPATADTPKMVGAVWSPCVATTPGSVNLRQRVVPGIRDCPVNGTALPLIVLSHGARGWFGGHHDTASALADAGFVVAAVTHPDQSQQWQTARPATIKRLIDHMLADWPDHNRLQNERIGFFGFSRGAYTGLVLLGAKPDFARMVSHCQKIPADFLCRLTTPGQSIRATQRPKRTYAHDSRIKAAVLAAPPGLAFSPAALKRIKVPIQLWRPENDKLLTFPYNAQAVYDGLSVKPEYHVVPGANHFSILAPCSEQQALTTPELCRDTDTFDREVFHDRLNQQVVDFFRRKFG